MLHIQNTTLGLCANPYAPQKKLIWGALAGAGASLLGGLLGGAQQHIYTKEQQRLQSQLNREEQEHSMALQQQNQEWLMNRQYGASVSGMKNAGLNPATANGTAPATPALGHPSSGSSGPAASMPNFDLAGAIKEGELMQAQIDNINADTQNKKSQSSNFDADTRLKEIQARPDFVKAGLDKLSGEAQLAWCQSDLTAKQSVKYMAEVQKIGKDMQLTDAQINNLQSQTAKAYQDIQESISRISLNKAEQYFKITGASLNKALAVQAHANAAEANERVNSGLYKSQSNLNYMKANEAEANEALLRKKGFTEEQITECKKIEAKLLEFDQKVNDQYGALDKGSLQYARDLLNLLSGGLLGGSAPKHSFSTVYMQR